MAGQGRNGARAVNVGSTIHVVVAPWQVADVLRFFPSAKTGLRGLSMRDKDFDIDSLAAFLHVLPVQVARLANRGKLPGRKVGGQWRFSRAEIHLWMEQRIGLSDDHQLEKMERILEQSARPALDGPIVISELLTVNALAVPLRANTRGSVILEMTALAAQTGLLWDPGKMAQAVRDREEMHPTALDDGVALLHPRRPMPSILEQPLLALGITRQGIPFGAGSGGSAAALSAAGLSPGSGATVAGLVVAQMPPATPAQTLPPVPAPAGVTAASRNSSGRRASLASGRQPAGQSPR